MKKIFFALSALLVAAVSCTEKEPAGQDEIAPATYYLVSNQTEVATLAENRSKDVNLNVKTREAVGGPSNLTFTLKTDLAQVDAYNTANGTDYLPMPADAFSFEKPSVSVVRFGTNSTTTKVTLKANGIEAGKTYVLPVTIDEVTGGEYKIDETACTVYLLLALYSENAGGGDQPEVDITAGLYDDPCLPADETKTPDLVIKTVEDMLKLPTIIVDGEIKYAVLEADVDMSSVKDWQALNTVSPYTKGLEFNGNGHTIKNFSCNQGAYRSFFGIMYGKCYDVKFENAVIDGTAGEGTQPCGVIAGYAGNKTGKSWAVIHDVEATGTITAKAGGVGGLVGVAVNLVMKRSSFSGNIENNGRRMGGLVGYHNCQEEGNYLRIEDCWTAGSITGVQNIGGIVGQTQYDNGKNGFNVKASIVRNCYSTMSVTANQNAGGIAGGCSYGGSYADLELDITKEMIIGNIAWNDKVESLKATTGNYSSSPVVGYANIYQYFVNNYRKADMSFIAPIDQLGDDGKTVVKEDAFSIVAEDQDNTSPQLSLYTGTTLDSNCKNPYKYYYPYHGKAAPAGATVSSLAKQLKWDETVWDLSGNLPVLK